MSAFSPGTTKDTIILLIYSKIQLENVFINVLEVSVHAILIEKTLTQKPNMVYLLLVIIPTMFFIDEVVDHTCQESPESFALFHVLL